jgi:hypothetical protein
MKKYLIIVSLLLAPAMLSAQLFQARFVTSALAWERQDTVGKSTAHLFGNQTLQFSLAGKNLSLHTYLQGFNDFGGELKNDPQYRLYNLYLKASNLFDLVDLSVGRQTVFAGVGVGSMDGGLFTVKTWESKLRVTGYYGLLPAPAQKAELIGDRKHNFMTGGQVLLSPWEFGRFSLSYTKKDIQPDAYTAIRRDSLFNPISIDIKPSASEEEYLSGDVSIDYGDFVSGYARYDYDMNFNKSSRVQLFSRAKVVEDLNVTGEYIYREPRLSYNSLLSVFTYNTLNEYEFGFEYVFEKPWQVFGKFGYVSYGDESSNRMTVGVNGSYCSVSITQNLGYGGELSGASLTASYPCAEWKLTPTLMVSYAQYRLSDQVNLENVLSSAFGVVYRPLTMLSFDTQVQWIRNKIYSNDVRLFFRLSYALSERLDLF